MFKLFLADLRQLKRTFFLLVLSIPLLQLLDTLLYRFALPRTFATRIGDSIMQGNENFTAASGWFFAMMASIILLLFSTESSSEGRLASLLSLPLNRWQVAVLRYLPALVIIPALGLLLNAVRLVQHFCYALLHTDLWRTEHTVTWSTIQACWIWAFDKLTTVFGAGQASLPFQFIGWVSMALMISSLPLLIDDIWPGIKRSSFSLWLSTSLFLGIALQAGIFGLGKVFGLEMIPHMALPASITPAVPAWQPSLLLVELLLALGILSLELWWFQRRSSYI